MRSESFSGISEVIKNHKRIAELAGENPNWNFNFVDIPAFLRRDNK